MLSEKKLISSNKFTHSRTCNIFNSLLLTKQVYLQYTKYIHEIILSPVDYYYLYVLITVRYYIRYRYIYEYMIIYMISYMITKFEDCI